MFILFCEFYTVNNNNNNSDNNNKGGCGIHVAKHLKEDLAPLIDK